MVKAEKIVVLSILFLVVGLFGWSLGAETETAEGQAGGDDGQAATAPGPQAGVETFARRAPAAACHSRSRPNLTSRNKQHELIET